MSLQVRLHRHLGLGEFAERQIDTAHRVVSIRIDRLQRQQVLQRVSGIQVETHLVFKHPQVIQDSLIIRFEPIRSQQRRQSVVEMTASPLTKSDPFAHRRKAVKGHDIPRRVREHALVSITSGDESLLRLRQLGIIGSLRCRLVEARHKKKR